MSRGLFERLLHKHASPVDTEDEQRKSDHIADSATENVELEPHSLDTLPLDDAALDSSKLDSSTLNETDALIEVEELESEQAVEGLSTDNELASEDVEGVEDEERKQGNAMSALLASDSAPEIKKRALRSLFFSGQFSEVDELNDYHQDFSQMKPLSADVASKLRHWAGEKASDLSEEIIEQSEIDTENSPLAEEKQVNTDKELCEHSACEPSLDDEAQKLELAKQESSEQDLADNTLNNKPESGSDPFKS
ncbi:DUF3306 domain-containing protein [Vibrio neonatus]|uniref:DUF3306 domain-containing protein n=1 Tax=Vibrio neonatus TaxID=278860 RepID=UPI0021C362FC|nr:DUF3306 domain-containing protein [Vibrio neonatus]